MVAAEVVVLRRIVELRIPAAEDIQPVVVRIRVVVRIQLLVDTVDAVVDTVLVAGIVEILEMDMMMAQELELDTDWVLRQRCDAGLMIEEEECRRMDLRYILLSFPCFSSYFCYCYYRKKHTAHYYRHEKYFISPFNDTHTVRVGRTPKNKALKYR